MPRTNIIIRNAHANNLKNIDLEIPKHKLVVFTGVSGSGKSSLLFDTLYTEAQRQLIEIGVGYLSLDRAVGTLSGGELLFQGLPEDLIRCERSWTGKHLKAVIPKPIIFTDI